MPTFIRYCIVTGIVWAMLCTLSSCTILYIPYIRNQSNRPQVIRLSLRGAGMDAPASFPLANKVVEFRKNFGAAFTDSIPVVQIDATTWELTIPAQSTLTIPLNTFSYRAIMPATVLSIVRHSSTDTVFDYSRSKPVDRFRYKSHGLRISPKICYYDITD